MKSIVTWFVCLSAAGVWAQDVAPAPAAPAETPAVVAAGPGPDPALLAPTYLSEIVRHLYRWYMDESDVENSAGVEEFPFRVRRLDVELDPGDRSEFGEIILPLVGLSAKVKKTDYTIEDLGTEAKSDTFRIIQVSRVEVPETPPPDCTVVNLDYAEMKNYLFETRAQARFPDPAMIERLRGALRTHLGRQEVERKPGEQTVYLAPLSPVANELWVFWENGDMLIRFASDIDLENPDMWEHQALGIRTYDIENQTVVSLDEVPGSNEFLTRDQVGRALFNCIVLGKRLVMVNPDAE